MENPLFSNFRHYDEWNGKNQEQNGGGIHKISNVKFQTKKTMTNLKNKNPW